MISWGFLIQGSTSFLDFEILFTDLIWLLFPRSEIWEAYGHLLGFAASLAKTSLQASLPTHRPCTSLRLGGVLFSFCSAKMPQDSQLPIQSRSLREQCLPTTWNPAITPFLCYWHCVGERKFRLSPPRPHFAFDELPPCGFLISAAFEQQHMASQMPAPTMCKYARSLGVEKREISSCLGAPRSMLL